MKTLKNFQFKHRVLTNSLNSSLIGLGIIIISFFSCSVLLACSNKASSEAQESSSVDSISHDDYLVDSVDTYKPQGNDTIEERPMCQVEINDASSSKRIAFNNETEGIFQAILEMSPENKEPLLKEKKLWEAYHDAVWKLALFCEGDATGSPLFVNDVLKQSIQLRSKSLYCVKLFLEGMTYKPDHSKFTLSLVEEAYDKFEKSDNLSDGFNNEQLGKLSSLISTERKCWNEWIKYRLEVESKLTEYIREAYRKSTYLTIRTKLIQLKNQNQGCGGFSGDVKSCLLPENCSDKKLLAYPGFDVIWKKYVDSI